jgi:hypothetical protein
VTERHHMIVADAASRAQLCVDKPSC